MAKSITKGVGTSTSDIRSALEKLQIAAVDVLLNTGGLAIGSSSKAAVKIANTIYALIDGVIVKKTTAEIAFTAGDDTTNATFNIYLLTMNAAGTCTLTGGTEGATIGAVVLPTVPDDEIVVGAVIINPTGTGDFDAGTTALDDATVVPNAVYINTVGSFNPNALSL